MINIAIRRGSAHSFDKMKSAMGAICRTRSHPNHWQLRMMSVGTDDSSSSTSSGGATENSAANNAASQTPPPSRSEEVRGAMALHMSRHRARLISASENVSSTGTSSTVNKWTRLKSQIDPGQTTGNMGGKGAKGRGGMSPPASSSSQKGQQSSTGSGTGGETERTRIPNRTKPQAGGRGGGRPRPSDAGKNVNNVGSEAVGGVPKNVLASLNLGGGDGDDDDEELGGKRGKRGRRGRESDADFKDKDDDSDVFEEAIPPEIEAMLFEMNHFEEMAKRGQEINPRLLDDIDRFMAEVLVDSTKTSTGAVHTIIESPASRRTRIPMPRSTVRLLQSMRPRISDAPKSTEAYALASQAWEVLSKNVYFSEEQREQMCNSLARQTHRIYAGTDEVLGGADELVYQKSFRKGLLGIEEEKRRLALEDNSNVPERDFKQEDTNWDVEAVEDEDQLFNTKK